MRAIRKTGAEQSIERDPNMVAAIDRTRDERWISNLRFHISKEAETD